MLSLAMMATMSTAAFAADTEHTANQVWNIDGALNTATTQMQLEIIKASDVLVATLPVNLLTIIDTLGNVTVPDNAKIVNNSKSAIQVKEIKIELPSGNVFASKPETAVKNPNNRLWVYSINGATVSRGYDVSYTTAENPTTFKLNTNEWKIEANSELVLDIDLTVSKAVYKDVMEKTNYGTLTFTIGYVE